MKRPHLKKGFTIASFPPAKDLSLSDKFQMLKDAGFDGVEMNIYSTREEVLAARDKAGLPVIGIACGPHPRAFSNPSEAERKKGLDGLLQDLRNAKDYGAKSILLVPGGVNEKISYADCYKRTREEIQKAIPLAEELGIVMAFENVLNNFLLSPLEAARYVDDFKSSAVGWHFDVGNVMPLGWPEQWIRILGKRIQKIHIKEFSRAKMNKEGLHKGFSVEYLEGDNDWPGVMRALDDVGYKGWCVIEDACGSCRKNLSPENYLKKVSGQLDRILAS